MPPIMRLCFLLRLLSFSTTLVQSTTWPDPNDYTIPAPPSSNRAVAGYPEYDGPVWTPSEPCPRAIHAEPPCPYGSDECRFDNMSHIHSALVHCPEIEELNLFLADGYCRDNHVVLFNETLPIVLNERYPALKRLTLDGYRFGGPWAEEPQEDPKVWNINTSIFDDCGTREDIALVQNLRRERTHQTAHTSLTDWLEVMDWEQLEELSINWARNPESVLVQKLARSGRLKNLKSLDITSLGFVEALDNNTLTQLRWIGRTAEGDLESILLHQGQSLRRLEYRCDEAVCPESFRSFSISMLPALAPNLEHISVNIPRNGTLPIDDLMVLASMPNLQTADLFFRMRSDCHVKEEALGIAPGCGWGLKDDDDSESCNGAARFQLPFVNRTTGEDVFKIIRENKQGKEMQNITLWAGNWVPGWPARCTITSWRRARVACTMNDDVVTCDADGRLYYKGIWDRMDHRLRDIEERLAPGVELTDEELYDEYIRRRREAETREWAE